MTIEVHTTKTFSLGDPHKNDDDNMNASDDGGEVQGDSDYHEPNGSPKMLGLVVL